MVGQASWYGDVSHTMCWAYLSHSRDHGSVWVKYLKRLCCLMPKRKCPWNGCFNKTTTPTPSKPAASWFQTNKINVMLWPAQSPDLNPIENLWGDIKNAVPYQSVTLDVTSEDRRLGYRLERPIHFECKLNEPMHIGMQLLHPAAADHSVSINRQQVQRIFSFSLRSRAVTSFCSWLLLNDWIQRVEQALRKTLMLVVRHYSGGGSSHV